MARASGGPPGRAQLRAVWWFVWVWWAWERGWGWGHHCRRRHASSEALPHILPALPSVHGAVSLSAIPLPTGRWAAARPDPGVHPDTLSRTRTMAIRLLPGRVTKAAFTRPPLDTPISPAGWPPCRTSRVHAAAVTCPLPTPPPAHGFSRVYAYPSLLLPPPRRPPAARHAPGAVLRRGGVRPGHQDPVPHRLGAGVGAGGDMGIPGQVGWAGGLLRTPIRQRPRI